MATRFADNSFWLSSSPYAPTARLRGRLTWTSQSSAAIRHVSVITALIGAALGLPLGIFLALLVTQALSQYDIAISIPLPELVGFTVVAILAGIGAAIIPARRASRLNVLDALHYE